MLKKIEIFLIFAVAVITFCSCRTVPDGVPPEQPVTIRQTVENDEPVAFNEALNLMSTELAVNVFSKFKGELRILFKNNASGNDVTRRLYHELKVFLPVKSVIHGEDFIIESSFKKIDEKKKFWYLRLKDRSGMILWQNSTIISDEV